MAGIILLFDVTSEKKSIIKDICKKQKISVKEVRPADYLQSLGFLAGIAGFKRQNMVYRGAGFDNEMMVFSGIDSDCLDNFLATYNNSVARPIDRKAVLTLHNIRWTPQQLYLEISKEHAAMHPDS